MVDVISDNPSPTPGILSAPAEDTVLDASCPQAAPSGCQSQSGADSVSAPYVVVQFDDGPESGLLAETCEEDYCHPQFWRFQEVHSKPPKAKILFDDGVTLFTAELPSDLEGRIADEDGDEHNFIRAERPPALGDAPEKTKPKRHEARKVAEQPSQLDDASSAVTRRAAGGGYGHVTVEAVMTQEEEVDAAQIKAAKQKQQKGKRDKDDDWAPDRRKQRPTSGKDATAPRRKRLKRIAADRSGDEAKASEAALVAAELTVDRGACEAEAVCSEQVAAVDSTESADRAPLQDAPESGAQETSSIASGVRLQTGGPAESACGQSSPLAFSAPPAGADRVLDGDESDSDVEVFRAELPALDGVRAAAQVASGASNGDDSDDLEMHVVK